MEILKSISYNNLNREIFVFFAEQYYQIKESDQRKFQEVEQALDSALAFMRERERPWEVLFFMREERFDRNREALDLFIKNKQLKSRLDEKQRPYFKKLFLLYAGEGMDQY